MKQENSNDAMNDFDEDFKEFFTICRFTQCSFCLNNESLFYHHQVYEYVKSHQMMNEVERHLKRFVSADEVSCSHSQCKTTRLILSEIMTFKNHTATMHKIFLRVWAFSLDTFCRLSIVPRVVELFTCFYMTH